MIEQWLDSIYSLSANNWNYHIVNINNNSMDMTLTITILSTLDAVIDAYLLLDNTMDLPLTFVSPENYSCRRQFISNTIGSWSFVWKQQENTQTCSKLEPPAVLKGRFLVGIYAYTDVVYQLEKIFEEQIYTPPFTETQPISGVIHFGPSLFVYVMSIFILGFVIYQ